MKLKFLNKIKKGGLTSTQLVTIFLIVAGLVIISLFIYRANLGGNVDREVCHESVVIRGTLPNTFWADPKALAPLKCQTRKICFSDNLIEKGECGKNKEEVLGKKFDTIRVSSDLEKQDTQIKTMIAREMADCWNMMGEGKLQLFPKATFTYERRCVVCSIAYFEDNAIKTKNPEVDGMAYYLMSHLVPNTNKTYLEYLSRSNVDNLFFEKGKKLEDIDKLDITKPKAVVYLEMDRSYFGKLLGFGTGAIATGFVLGSVVPGVGNVIGAGVVIIGGTIGANLGDNFIRKSDNFKTESAAGLFLIDYDAGEFKKLGCDSLENIP